MPLIHIENDLFDRISNDFTEDDEDISDGIRRLLKFYDEQINEDDKE